MTEPANTPQEWKNDRQYIKFGILVSLVSDMLAKQRRESGKLTKEDSSGRYNEAVDAIMQWHEAEASRREQALLDTILDIIVKRGMPDNYYGEVSEWIKEGLAKRQALTGEEKK